MPKKPGRPPKKGQVRVNWRVKVQTKANIKSMIVKGGNPASYGEVLDEVFKDV